MNETPPPGTQTTMGDGQSPDPSQAPECLEGTVQRIVFEGKDSGFLVGRLNRKDRQGIATFVGTGLAVSPGETVRLWGRWIDDKKFGRQMRVERYQIVLPSTAAAIEKYLGSGLIEGIGPVYAKRLVKAFGVETLRIIDEEPGRLRDVEGIGKKRAAQIREAWLAQHAVQSIMLFLQGHGIAPSMAVRIYKHYGDKAVAILRDNPYRLAEDIPGIAFKTADEIAAQLGIEADSPKRAAAGLLHTLRKASGEGDVFLPVDELTTHAKELLATEGAPLDAALADMVGSGRATREGDRAFLPALHAAETGCTRLLKRLLSVPGEHVTIDTEKAITWVEKTNKLQLSEEQREAIRLAARTKVMVITGGPGTGKTTLLNGLISIFARKGLDIRLAAPTGRAAKRMTGATGRDALTIHRLLEWSPKFGGFTRHDGNPLSTDLVVIDESSMVDIVLMHHLLKALPPEARLILVGDVDQLPSVGPGNVLMDIIASQLIPVVWLKTVFRQAAESGIISNAHRINEGQQPVFNERDFFFVERTDPQKAADTILELVTRRIPKKFGLDALRDIQVLAPMHRGDAGVARLNETLRAALNGNSPLIPGRTFGLYDKVMQIRNNYELEAFNGDVGVVSVVDETAQEIQVRYEEHEVLYEYEQLDELTLAYASTVHKAQGSEYPAVVVPLLTQHFPMLQRNVVYTAITRARQIVVIVGDPKAVRMAVQNVRVTRRHTALAERLRNRPAG
ncbi:MAG: ATP-dependent RecD-like DNA helicase [Candidatus Hydrogenedentes bacterium]|nr:ATP-dependent RecD-like DNA helicase [Candidatus Hydrogenedentota bacterium]